jgi:hypothetical protein
MQGDRNQPRRNSGIRRRSCPSQIGGRQSQEPRHSTGDGAELSLRLVLMHRRTLYPRRLSVVYGLCVSNGGIRLGIQHIETSRCLRFEICPNRRRLQPCGLGCATGAAAPDLSGTRWAHTSPSARTGQQPRSESQTINWTNV